MSVEGIEEADHVVPQFVRGAPDRFGTGGDEQGARRDDRVTAPVDICADRSQAPPESVADHGTADTLGDGERHPGWIALGAGQVPGRERTTTDPNPL